MKYAIICSNADSASQNIKSSLLTLFDFVELEDKFDGNNIHEFVPKEELFEAKNPYLDSTIKIYTTDKQLIVYDNIDKKIDANLLIFASKHQSTSKIASLTCHSLGNFDMALYGGITNKLSKSNPYFLREMYLALNKHGVNLHYDIINEATHHGPYTEKPSLFVEVGSTPKEWENRKAGDAIANSIMDAIKNYSETSLVALGLGGLHSCNEFNKVVLRTNISFSFICPKHSLDFIDEDKIKYMMDRSYGKVSLVVLDFKGLGKNKERIIALLDKMGVKYIKSLDIKNSVVF